MANFIFKKAKESFLKGEINLINNSIKVLLVNNTYSPNESSHQYVSDIAGSSIEYRSNALQAKVVTNGVFDADNILIENYSGNSFKALVIYVDTGVDSTSRLIAYIDNSDGLPFSSANTSATVTIVWSDSSNKILSI